MSFDIQTNPKGRSPKGKFYFGDNAVKIDTTRTRDCQVGKLETYNRFADEMKTYGYDYKHVFGMCGLSFFVLTTSREHSQFVHNMFNVKEAQQLLEYEQSWTILHNMNITTDPRIWINLDKKEVLISGTTFLGEIKKTIFTIMGYSLPQSGSLPMHCSAFMYEEDTALMFGLSGTGKTTLSADPEYALIGDDEIAWDDQGLHAIEAGCYAKTADLDRETQPTIFEAMDVAKNRGVLIEENNGHANSRSSYPLDCVDGSITSPVNTFFHPKDIFFLAMDAEGTLPAISKVEGMAIRTLFENGYTSKMPGTEDGVNEIQRVFSPCYGGPFMPLPVKTYSDLLMDKVVEEDTNVFLVNTGMKPDGNRYELEYTRNCIKRALTGSYQTTDVIWHMPSQNDAPDFPIRLKEIN